MNGIARRLHYIYIKYIETVTFCFMAGLKGGKKELFKNFVWKQPIFDSQHLLRDSGLHV